MCTPGRSVHREWGNTEENISIWGRDPPREFVGIEDQPESLTTIIEVLETGILVGLSGTGMWALDSTVNLFSTLEVGVNSHLGQANKKISLREVAIAVQVKSPVVSRYDRMEWLSTESVVTAYQTPINGVI